jgi:transcriptional regulator with XRE-family HTH domain
MGKRYKSVIDLVEDIIEDEEFKEELKKDLQDKSLAHKLFGMRCAAGITQSEMAEKIGCDQSRISKLENAGLYSIKVGDLLAYTKALELNLSIRFHKSANAADCIKFHVLEVKKQMDYLAGLAHGDSEICNSITKFFGDTFIDIINNFLESVEKLPVEEEIKPPTLEIKEHINYNESIPLYNRKNESENKTGDRFWYDNRTHEKSIFIGSTLSSLANTRINREL